VEILGESVNRVYETIDQLLDFSRNGSSDKTFVNLNDVASDTLALVRNYLDRFKCINLHTSLEENLPPTYANKNQLCQVLMKPDPERGAGS